MNEIINTELPKINEVFRREIYVRLGSQRIAAHALGVSEGHLSSIVNGWISPGQDFAERASSLFGRPVDELFPNLKQTKEKHDIIRSN
jgi:plasmid maintenance system antidote protein VapI